MITRHVERAATILMTLCLLAPGGTAARTSGRGPVRIRVLERTAQPLLVSDRPWEAFTLSYLSVIKTGGMWQLWYGSYDPEYKYGSATYLCYARSSDGVHSTKPELSLVPFKGPSPTNILIDGRKIRANATNFFRDEHAPPSERYKALLQAFLGFDTNKHGVWQNRGAVSPDGLHWKVLPDPIYPWNSDTQNVAFWDKDRYRLYLRLWRGVGPDGKPFVSTETANAKTRTIGLAESPVFTSFPKGEEILAPQGELGPSVDYYSNACTKLRDDLYVMFISTFDKPKDLIRVHAAASRDGRKFELVGKSPALDLGPGFDSKGIYVAPGAVPGKAPNTYWFYYLGTATKHGDNIPSKAQRQGGLGRFLVEVLD